MQRPSRGFTLIELLIVIAIIAILAAILFPVFVSAREQGKRSKCASHYRQLNTSLMMYIDDNGGRFPYATNWFPAMDLCRTGRARGYYLVDAMYTYVKNSSIWLCPQFNPSNKIPNYPMGTPDEQKNFNKYRWNQNGGSETGKYSSVPSNVMYNVYIAPSYLGSSVRDDWIWNKKLGDVKSPSKAMVFIELPYWPKSPHYAGDGVWGCHLSYVDGHVKLQINGDANMMWKNNAIGWF